VKRTVTESYEVPKPGSPEAVALATLLGHDALDPSKAGFLVGWAAGKAALSLPDDARIVRVVVVAETNLEKT